ncbi:hypothetical protein ENSA5_22110 [Enhygromyxa salina]|uniref:Uncharacterized protein n=1 Tax=Enhygromyxa salina TaxID=215803 RepID=A0A2S9YC14_9BACT|nr:hypothetical protein [Enhygromyxa salina]PRQ02566.1 hypothetical protein ENSA5_22110 [Enhygromyxa salina]
MPDEEFAKLRQELLERLDTDGPITQLTAWQKLVSDIAAAMQELTLASEVTSNPT